MIKELVTDEAILSQPCEPATAEDAAVAQDLLDTLASLDEAACLAANQIGVAKAVSVYHDENEQPHLSLIHIAEALCNAEIVAQDFEKTIDSAKKGEFIYADPPYTVQHNNNGFVKYNETMFSWEDQKRLSVLLKRAAERGVKILASNADHPSIWELYSCLLYTSRCV